MKESFLINQLVSCSLSNSSQITEAVAQMYSTEKLFLKI